MDAHGRQLFPTISFGEEDGVTAEENEDSEENSERQGSWKEGLSVLRVVSSAWHDSRRSLECSRLSSGCLWIRNEMGDRGEM